MNEFAYRIYYEYQGPSAAAPLNWPKSDDEIRDALSAFPEDLSHYLSDPEARVSMDTMKRTPNSIFVVIRTTDSEAQVNEAVARCLRGFGLFGERMTKG